MIQRRIETEGEKGGGTIRSDKDGREIMLENEIKKKRISEVRKKTRKERKKWIKREKERKMKWWTQGK